MSEQDEKKHKSRKKPVALVVVKTEGPGEKTLQSLLQNSYLTVKGAFLHDDDHEAAALAEHAGIQRLKSMESIAELKDVELLLNYDSRVDQSLYELAREKGISLLSGNARRLLEQLIIDSEEASQKQEDLIRGFDDKVRKFAVQNELSHIITTTFQMDRLLQNIVRLCMRVTNTNAGAILMYDGTIQKFTISSAIGLSEKFIYRIKLPLSDPFIEDLITIRKEIALSKLSEIHSSIIFDDASKEGMKSMLALPLLTKEKLIGILCIFSREILEFSEKERDLMAIIVGQVALAIENADLYKSSREKQMLVEQLLSKLIFAQEEERKRIASEIHDSIAQSMVGILTKVQTSQALLSLNLAKAAEELEDLRKVAAESCKEIRRILFNLRPTSLDDLGIVPSIENLIKRIEKEKSISIQMIVNDRDRRFPPQFEILTFRIIQEALTNVLKHSEAKKAWVELFLEPARLSIKVVDNGRGFTWEKVHHKFTEGESFGLQSMKERASLVGGKVDIISEENNGTTVSIEIPVDRSFTGAPDRVTSESGMDVNG